MCWSRGLFLLPWQFRQENVEKLDHTYSIKTQDQYQFLQCQPKLVPASLKERMLADGTMEPLPQLPARNPKECGLPYLSKEPLDGLKPATRAVPGTYCWGEDLYKKGVRPFSEVAEGRMTVKEFLAQMTDEEVAHLLGDSRLERLPAHLAGATCRGYGSTELYDGRRTGGTSDRTGVRCDHDSLALCYAAGSYLESECGIPGWGSRRKRSKGK
ncbi:MAG: hypothetical protein ACLSG9_12435 [Eubacterium sp.]